MTDRTARRSVRRLVVIALGLMAGVLILALSSAGAATNPTITFTPLATPTTVGNTATLHATDNSGQTITYSVGAGTSPTDTCTVAGETVTYANAGTCVVTATAAASRTYAAGTASQSVTVEPFISTVTLPTPATTVYGENQTVSASVSEANGADGVGTVQFAVDGIALGSPVTTNGGAATSPPLGDLSPGTHTVSASFTPASPNLYGSGSASTSATVDQASSTTVVSVNANTLSATVSAAAPGGGTPSGSVSFLVDGQPAGSATLSDGSASISIALSPTYSHSITATYGGDPNFTGSSDVATTAGPTPMPTIFAKVSGSKNRYGWYQGPVRVRFSCSAGGTILSTRCPATVVITTSRADQSLTRTVSATNGTSASVTVSHINVDITKPKVKITGVTNGGVYAIHRPKPRCRARDAVSGIASCSISYPAGHTNPATLVTSLTYQATAFSRANQRTVVRGHYTALGLYLRGAAYIKGSFRIHPGRTYTIVLRGYAHAPRYVKASPGKAAPSGDGGAFRHVRGGWSFRVTLTKAMFAAHHRWNIGVQINGRTHVLAVIPAPVRTHRPTRR